MRYGEVSAAVASRQGRVLLLCCERRGGRHRPLLDGPLRGGD